MAPDDNVTFEQGCEVLVERESKESGNKDVCCNEVGIVS